MIIAAIVICEIAFWIVVVAGLLLRYVGRRDTASMVVLTLVPIVDLALLIAVAWNLHDGGTATVAHSLATFYLGFTVAYGHRMIAWIDVRFAHRFASGPRPEKLYGRAYARKCWADVPRTVVACAIAAAIAGILVWWQGISPRTVELKSVFAWAGLITGADILYAISYTVWPRRAPRTGVS